MTRRRWMSLGLIALAVAGCKDKPRPETAAPAEEAQRGVATTVTMTPAEIKAAGVLTVPVVKSAVTVFDEMPGTIEAPSDALVIINARASGVVEALEVDVGDRVTAGQRLATVRSTELAKAQADYRHSVISEEHAAAALKRSEALEKDGLISQRRLEADRLLWQASHLQIEESSERIKILGGSIKDATGTIAITTPISGTVATRSSNRGEAVAENAKLFTVVDISRVVVQLRAPGGLQIVPGTEVNVAVEVLPGRVFTATVKSTSDVIDPETRRFFVRCTVTNADGVLKPGMFVTAKVPRPRVKGLSVPETSIVNMEGGTAVFVAHEGGSFERRSVVLGPRANGEVAVQSGLSEGEPVVTAGAFWVRTKLQKSELEE